MIAKTSSDWFTLNWQFLNDGIVAGFHGLQIGFNLFQFYYRYITIVQI